MDGLVSGWMTDGRTGGRRGRRTDWSMDRWMYGWMGGKMDGQTDTLVAGWMNKTMDRRLYEWRTFSFGPPKIFNQANSNQFYLLLQFLLIPTTNWAINNSRHFLQMSCILDFNGKKCLHRQQDNLYYQLQRNRQINGLRRIRTSRFRFCKFSKTPENTLISWTTRFLNSRWLG